MSELNYWLIQVSKGRISRREFLGRTAVLGLTAAAATSFLSKAGLAATEPKKGGFARFALAHGATTDSLDPGTWPDTFTQCAFYGAMLNNLTEIDERRNIVGDLAESMEPDDGAKRWIFKLKRGVTFHNGKDLTSSDVAASFQYHMGADSKSAAKSLLEAVTNIKTDGPQSVIFALSGGNADFPYIVSDYHLPIFPEKDGRMDFASHIGSGAFILENFDPGVSAKLKRNPNYHKNGMPYFDEVEFLSMHDATARTNALRAGDVHFMAACELKTLDLLKSDPKIVIQETTGIGHYTFAMNTKVAPFDNVDVRLALKYAIDREEIASKIFLGHASPGNDNPIAPAVKYSINPEPVHSYDPEKAKFHLKKAGLSSLKVDLSVADAAFVGAVDAATLYQASAKAANIELTVMREANDAYWDNIWMKKPFCAVYWSGRATCDWMLSTTYASGAAWNDTFWDNPRFNELLVAARAETDEKKRAEMYAETQQLIHTDGGVMVLVFNNYVNAHVATLGHGELGGTWDLDGLRIAERWWFNS